MYPLTLSQAQIEIDTMMREHQESLQPRVVGNLRAPIDLDAVSASLRGEQPNNPALPVDGALSGDTPRSNTSESEVK